MEDNYTYSFIESAQARNNMFHDLDDTKSWLKSLQEKTDYKVEQIPLEELDHWYFETDTGNLKHSSGKFFSIVGLDCKPAYDAAPWQQPIICQPEVGILGIISREFDGVRYFLMQAKMEPGNINKVQISPTLQATYSNYTQTHKGKTPAYLEYFLDANAKVIRSQLQSETGSRFFRKFNRNVLLDVTTEVEVLPGFRWLTLYEIQSMMALDNAINMDSRSVLSNVSYSGTDLGSDVGATEFFRSVSCDPGAAHKSQEELRDWLAAMRNKFVIDTTQIPLRAEKDWVRDESGIHHAFKNY
ncbi:MAG: NDP-hexose 2,3-dehydratase family protein, partial [Pseudomonadota bacterium]